jgi:hypothetical protein
LVTKFVMTVLPKIPHNLFRRSTQIGQTFGILLKKSHSRASIVRGRRLSYKMCAFAPRHAASAANRHKGGLGSPPKMLHESSSTKSWQFMAVNHSVYLVLGWAMLLHGYAATWLFCYGSAHESFQKERDPEIMDSFFTTPWRGSKAVVKFQVQDSNHQHRIVRL